MSGAPILDDSPAWFQAEPFGLNGERGPLRAASAITLAPFGWLEGERDAFLHPSEAVMLTDRMHPRRRHSLLAGRHAAKGALAALVPGLAPRAVAIRPGVLEQPVVAGPGTANLQVSLSHAGPVALAVAFPESCPMGVDVELIAPDRLAAMESQTTPSERSMATAVAASAEEGLTRLWCLKEALSKVLRCGLTVPFELLEVSRLTPDGPVYRADFTNFGQYLGISRVCGRLAVALVLPRNVQPVGTPPWMGAWGGWLSRAAAALEGWSE